ncbi:MAG: PIN domain-containing protein [Nocardioidaceae bacterium]
MLLVDTNVWLSAADGNSSRHDESVAVIEAHQSELAATVPVIAETSWLILDRLGTVARTEFLDRVVNGALRRIELLQEDWARIRALCTQYADLKLDVVDASVVAVAERLKLDTIATYSHRDFRVIVPSHTAGFTLLPE